MTSQGTDRIDPWATDRTAAQRPIQVRAGVAPTEADPAWPQATLRAHDAAQRGRTLAACARRQILNRPDARLVEMTLASVEVARKAARPTSLGRDGQPDRHCGRSSDDPPGRKRDATIWRETDRGQYRRSHGAESERQRPPERRATQSCRRTGADALHGPRKRPR